MNNEIKIAKPTIDELHDVVKSCVLKLDEKEMYYLLATIALYEKDEKEIDRLHSIIKEVREYIKQSNLGCDLDESETFFIKDGLLSILDKVKENNNE